jgi:hypothetical protein
MPNSRFIMVASSVCLAIAGITCLFLPSETMALLGMPANNYLIVQILGALYLGFAAANWTARGSMIGGIYARPISVANFFHFIVGASILAKEISNGYLNAAYIAVTLAYLVFAILFTLLLFGRIERAKQPDSVHTKR